MKEERGLQDLSENREVAGPRASKQTEASGAPCSEESRRGPTWRGWVLSILVAIALSVTATLLLGGSGAFRSDRAVVSVAAEGGRGGPCCPPADAGK
jgi:hypothetical protein